MALTRDALLERKTKTLDLSIGQVKIRQLSAGEYARSAEAGGIEGVANQSRFVNQAAYACAHALVEPDIDGDEWEQLRDSLPLDVLGDLYEAVSEFSGLGGSSAEEEVDQRVDAFPAAGDGSDGEADAPAAAGEEMEPPAA